MTFPHTEEYISQIPALQLLVNCGYQILTPKQAIEERQGKYSNVLLENILRTQLQKFNRIQYKGKEYHFSEANIQEAIQKIKNVKYDGLQKTNEVIYDLITLGTALEQTIEGNNKSFTLNYIDWKIPSNNVFHVTAEFTVEQNRSVETARPDIVLFVNGIPLAVIECKSPAVEVEQAISQNIRNQGDDYIPKLFTYVQLVMAVNKNAAQYATAGTPAEFWGVWREIDNGQLTVNNDGELRTDTQWYKELSEMKNKPLSIENKHAIEQTFHRELSTLDSQLPTPQDAALYSLCRPQRLLDLTYRFTLFDNGIKKIARYQQFFVVRSILTHIKRRNREGIRAGGVIWHTQGSGKSLTMVMLTRALVLNNGELIIDNEKGRIDNEQRRIDNEKGRIDNEQRRIDNEKGRIDNGQWRIDNEKGRIDNGQWRIDNEKGRIDNEQRRIDNEQLIIDKGQQDTEEPLSTLHSQLSIIKNPRIILVTDRDNLDKQLGNTFAACGLSKERATSGRNLVKHLKEKVGIITTLIHKFDKGWVSEKYVDESPDIFVLVDESHRTNFGSLAARMRQMLPNACYLGFTGTPLLKKEKNNFSKFGGLIEPHYSIRQAVKDKAVLPLLYEGRHVEMIQNQDAIDLWFNRHTSDLNKNQQADLKRKYACAEMLNKSDQVIYMRAFDISEHYRANWQDTGFKAQLVAPSKAAALKYHEYLKDIGFVTSEVIISPPDTREGHEEVDEGPTDEVGKFWNKMMKRFGSEEEYTKQVINQFKNGEEPEILIVVDKLLTGFDAPKNTVLYLCRTLREHTLLQAIARVNRLYKDKDFGYIVDYASVLGKLDEALTMYDALEGFDEEDLLGTLTSVNEEVQRLPQRYSHLWDVFREVKNKHDEEAFEVLLADDELRKNFYERLAEYSKTLGIALSTAKFIMETNEAKLRTYKNDLKSFQNLKKSVKLRYAESIDYSDYEPKLKKLLDTHIQANEVTQLNKPVDIFDDSSFHAIKQSQGIYSNKSTAARADTIAHAMKRVINEKMGEDPAFYKKFSKLIQDAIDDFKARRISDLDYLNKVSNIRNTIVSEKRDDVPDSISDNDEACAYYGIIKPYFMKYESESKEIDTASVETSLAIRRIMKKHWKVDFWMDDDAQNSVINDIDDFFYDEVKDTFDIALSSEQMTEIIDKTMQIAKNRRHT